MHCDALNDFLVEPFSFTIADVDPDIAGKRVGENNTQLFSWHWPGDDESILQIVTSIMDMIILSLVNAAIAGQLYPSQKIWELWGCLQEHNGDGGRNTRNVTPIFDINTAAGSVKVAMKLSNPTLFCLMYGGQQADGTDVAQIPMRVGCSNFRQDYILPPPADNMINDIREESDDDDETRHLNPRSFPRTKSGFQKFERKLQKMIIKEQQYLEVIRICALGLLAEYERRLVADRDVAWIPEHDHIVNPPSAGSLANRKRSSSCPAAN